MTDVSFENDGHLVITFGKSDYVCHVTACSECCDVNWFEGDIPSDLVGAVLLEIEEGDLVDSTSNVEAHEFLQTFPVTVTYSVDGVQQTWTFFRKNSSNGYYSGHLDVDLV